MQSQKEQRLTVLLATALFVLLAYYLWAIGFLACQDPCVDKAHYIHGIHGSVWFLL